MISKIELNEENIHLSTLLPSNIIAEIEECKTGYKNDESNKEKKIFQNQINFNSIKCSSNMNPDISSDMELETNKNDFSYSNRSNTIFSSFFQEEYQKIKQKNPQDIENNVYYNKSFLNNNVNNINIFNVQTFFDKCPFGFNNNNNNKNSQDINDNQILNNIINQPVNQSRFANYFKMNKNESISDCHDNINNNNNNIINSMDSNINNNNNIINSMNSNINKNENNTNYNYTYNNSFKKFEFNPNNLNYIKKNNIECNDYQKTNDIQNINGNNKNRINNNIINDGENNDAMKNILIPNHILNQNQDYKEFLDYVNSLNTPLIKFLCTKKGISEMENYLCTHKSSNIEILIYLLNKEGLTRLMKHKFGNYFIQEIIRDAKYPQIKMILELISHNFVEISESNSGTHTIQTLLDKVNVFELRNIVLKSIENKELEMAFNNNATYVLQKIIGIVPDVERLNTNEVIINNAINLALNSDCVFIVEKFISTITIKENKTRIKNVLCENCIQLATSPFGNYLIQYLFQVWKNDDIEEINNIIIENANFLAKQRYSSNVIEKAVDTYDNKIKPRLIRSLSLDGSILEIIKNQYGHYVLNKAIKYMDDGLKAEIEAILTSQMPEMTKKEKTKSKKFIGNLKKYGKKQKNVKK